MEEITVDKLKEVGYNLYVADWLREHISTERLLQEIREYHLTVIEDCVEGYDFNAFLEDVGFDGELYVCFDEFCDNEFEDSGYMHELFGNSVFGKAYDRLIGGEQ